MPRPPPTLKASLQRPQAAVWRADLLLSLVALGDSAATVVAALARFDYTPHERVRQEKAPLRLPPGPPGPPVRSSPVSPSSTQALEPVRALQYAVISTPPVDIGPDDISDAIFGNQGSTFDQRLLGLQEAVEPRPAPLAPPRRMAAMVRRALRPLRRSRQLDIARWIALLAQARPPQHLPLRLRRTWTEDAGLIWLARDDFVPFAHDAQVLSAQVRRWSGGRAKVLQQAADGQWAILRSDPARHPDPWVNASAQQVRSLSTALVVTGGGAAGAAHDHSPPWLPLAGRGAWPAQGLTLLMPTGEPLPPTDWPRGKQVVDWDHGSRLHSRTTRAVAPALKISEHVSHLLALLSLAVRVEPHLLRALRLHLQMPAAVELAVWRHGDVQACWLGFQIAPDRLGHYREHLQALPLAARRVVAEMVHVHHLALSELIQLEEAGLALALAGWQSPAAGANWLKAARTQHRGDDPEVAAAISRYVRRTASRTTPALWQQIPGLAEAYVLADEVALRAGAAPPDGLPAHNIQRLLSGRTDSIMQPLWHVVQHGQSIRLQPHPARRPQRALGVVGPCHAESGAVVSSVNMARWVPLMSDGAVVARLVGVGPWTIQAGQSAVTISALGRPAWAQEWGCDRSGVYAALPGVGQLQARVRASPDESAGVDLQWIFQGQQARVLSRHQQGRADWALGVDRRFGVFAELNIGATTQTFRYLPPGEFWMGGREDEPGHHEDESPRHRIGLSQGFWLADTACTHALWQSVMGGKNRSGYKGDAQRPVEGVSFDDVQTFLARLQALLPPGCEPVLPTEAQWEYACRAGTDTAFNTGTTMDRSQANFDADFGTPLAPRGEHSNTTVPVKSLPPNAWGLYEMHGNVWEWCDDDRRDYAATAVADGVVVDPAGQRGSGPKAVRAVRGGAWFSGARRARSATRGVDQRGCHSGGQGFRFALRSTSPGGPEGYALGSGPEGRQGFDLEGQDAPPTPRRPAEATGVVDRSALASDASEGRLIAPKKKR